MSTIPVNIFENILSLKNKYPFNYHKYTTFEGVLTQIYNQLNNSNNIIIISVLKEILINDCNIWEIEDFYINKNEYHYTINDIIENKRILRCQNVV